MIQIRFQVDDQVDDRNFDVILIKVEKVDYKLIWSSRSITSPKLKATHLKFKLVIKTHYITNFHIQFLQCNNNPS